jgi:hypothetical protein
VVFLSVQFLCSFCPSSLLFFPVASSLLPPIPKLF